MRKFQFIGLALLAIVPLLQSCNDADGDYPSLAALTTVQVPAGTSDYYFHLDNNKTVYPGDKSRIGAYDTTDKDGKRAIVYYSLLDQKKEGFDYNATMYDIVDVLTKKVEVATTAEEVKPFGNDRINIKQVWISGGWLNILYVLETSGLKSHKISLIENKTATAPAGMPADYTYLEFRQFADGDNVGRLYSNYVCYKLDAYDPAVTGKKGFYIRVNGLGGNVSYLTVDANKSDKIDIQKL
ncbi:MAG: NigD-like C-terminal domain-containing protein [Alistipes sp.]